jgi:tripartite-type tricarboxylate transporter receptor subunit TctC
MLPRCAAVLAPAVAAMIACAGFAGAQPYPNRYIRIITTDPGSGTDFVARMIAQGLGPAVGQQVIVDNRGGGVIAIELAAKAPPDGYTLLVFGSTLWLSPFLRSSVSWDPVRDFAPVTIAVSSPNIVAAHPSLPANSVKELIALAKERPGQLNYGSTIGGSTHLSAELFKTMAGVDIVLIPYKGNGPALNAVLGGQVQLMFATAAAASPHVKSGRLKALAVTTAQPSALFPGLPTVAASGLAGYDAGTLMGVFAPSRVPAAIVSRLNQEIAAVLDKPDVKARFFNAGVEAVGNSQEECAAAIKAEMAKFGKLIKDLGIREE